MKAGWLIKRFDDVLEIRNGKNQREVESKDGEYPIFGSAGNVMGYATSFICEAGTTIIGRKGNINTPIFSETNFWNVDTAFGLAVKPGLDCKFLYYYCLSFDFSALNRGTTIPSLVKSELLGISIPVPPLPEQQRIVTLLDEAFDGIATARANAEKNLQNARAIFESHLQSVFTQRGDGWIEKSLDELGTITSSKRIFKSEYVESGIPFYRTKEIKQLANGRDITTELFISEIRYNEIKAGFGVPKAGDILITAIGTIGEIWVVDGEEDFYFKDGNVLWLKEFTSVNPQFLRYVLLSFVDSLNNMSHGSAYSALPIQRLNVHRIFLPSQMEQEQIVAILDALYEATQRLESIYQQKLTALDALKKSLLAQAFSGAL